VAHLDVAFLLQRDHAVFMVDLICNMIRFISGLEASFLLFFASGPRSHDNHY
jgi:hypothetical protein